VADCKLATRENMDHLRRAGGRFLSVLPATRKEDGDFRSWLVDHVPGWVEAHRQPARRKGDPDERWWVAPAPWPSAEGYRIVWVKSSAKVARDAEARRGRIARGTAALDALNQRLASPKTRIKTTVAVEQAAHAALEQPGAARWTGFEVTEQVEERFRQEQRGRPGATTRYRRLTRTHHRLSWQVREGLVARDAAADGCSR
jgi:hypothetical protein